MKLVVNASPLILLAAAERLVLLRELGDEVVVPQEVLDELVAGESRDSALSAVHAADWIALGEPTEVAPVIAAWDLGAGETAVLSWAQTRAGWTCVLDDRAARSCARALRLSHVGTLGLVLAAKEAGLLSAARPILEEMMQAGFYLGNETLRSALRRVGE